MLFNSNFVESDSILLGGKDASDNLITSSDNIEFNSDEDNPADESFEDSDTNEENFDPEDLFVKALAITFNMWMNISGIAYSTVNLVVKEVI